MVKPRQDCQSRVHCSFYGWIFPGCRHLQSHHCAHACVVFSQQIRLLFSNTSKPNACLRRTAIFLRSEFSEELPTVVTDFGQGLVETDTGTFFTRLWRCPYPWGHFSRQNRAKPHGVGHWLGTLLPKP